MAPATRLCARYLRGGGSPQADQARGARAVERAEARAEAGWVVARVFARLEGNAPPPTLCLLRTARRP